MRQNVFNPACDHLLIIGNGFDKNCGLKTSYSDIYKEYINIPSENKVISEFKANISDNYVNWSDFELGMAEYAKNFNSEDGFIDCLNDFNSFMHTYLRGVQRRFSERWNELRYHENIRQEFVESINSLGSGVSHNVDNFLSARNIPNVSTLGIISFNYTEIFDLLLDLFYEKSIHKTPIHVHGKLGDDPILGMDRAEQLDVKFAITERFQRNFIKPFFNMEYDSERVSKARSLIDEARVIFVYGASLGDSDLSWRIFLGEWLQADPDHHLFIYDYSNSQKTFKTISERMNHEIMEKQILLANWGMTTADISLAQLHLPCGRNIFNIGDAMSKDTEKALAQRKKAEEEQRIRDAIANGEIN